MRSCINQARNGRINLMSDAPPCLLLARRRHHHVRRVLPPVPRPAARGGRPARRRVQAQRRQVRGPQRDHGQVSMAGGGVEGKRLGGAAEDRSAPCRPRLPSRRYRAWAIDPANRHGSGPPAMRPSLPFDGTTTHREMFKGWQLPPRRPALGVQMLGDVAYVLIPPNAPLPAVGRQVFTTVHDHQTEIRVLVLEGDFSQASRCNVLGHLDMTGLPAGPKGARCAAPRALPPAQCAAHWSGRLPVWARALRVCAPAAPLCVQAAPRLRWRTTSTRTACSTSRPATSTRTARSSGEETVLWGVLPGRRAGPCAHRSRPPARTRGVRLSPDAACRLRDGYLVAHVNPGP